MDNNVKIPNHVGLIIDGNGRWALEKGLSRSDGHKEGFENLKRLSVYILKRGIKYLSIYAFSTENFKRSEKEVNYLMNLFITFCEKDMKLYQKENIKVVFSGDKTRLSKNVVKQLEKMESATKNNTDGTLNVCLSYGGRQEIVDATKKIIESINENKIKIDEINDDTFNKYLYQDLPPMDFLIRTSGEQRLSNFMLFQAAYAEFYFPETYFPAFDSNAFEEALIEYTKRDRRFGGINYEKKTN